MKLLFYSAEQDVLRVYDTECECWEDMKDIFVGPKFKNRFTSLTLLIGWGWTLIGEL